jgi:hypothetical protein
MVSLPNHDKLTMRFRPLKLLGLILSLSKDEKRISTFSSSCHGARWILQKPDEPVWLAAVIAEAHAAVFAPGLYPVENLG